MTFPAQDSLDNAYDTGSIRAIMMRSVAVVLLSSLAALAACQQDKTQPAWDKGRDTVKPVKAGGGDQAKGGPAEDQPPAHTGSLEERVAKLEKRLDKVTGFLKQAVRPELDTTVAYAVPIDPADPVIGAKDAKVTVVEAYEYLCPYCNMVAPTVEQLLAQYPNDVRLVPKYFVIHGPPAIPAGQAACAAGKQGKYAEFNKAIWSHVWAQPGQPPNKDEAQPDSLNKIAADLGLDQAKFKSDMDGDCKDWIQRSGQTLQHFGAGGTPSFYINGRFVQAGDIAAFKQVIDEEIQKVNESGVKPADYYDKVVIGQGAKEAHMISPFDD